jgi:hypothetical protein
MTPSQSNLVKQGCSPVSSNCVIWEGPAIACLSLCKGDSVTDVVFKLATEVCEITEAIGLSDLDLSCLVTAPITDYTLKNILTLLINKVCTIPTGGITPPVVSDLIRVASCFQLRDSNGDLILDLPRDEYIRRIGLSLCTQILNLGTVNNILTDHSTRITDLENIEAPVISIPTVNTSCIFPNNSNPVSIVNAFEELESEFCAERTILGLPTDLALAIGKQCMGLDTDQAFSINGTMSALPGWKTPVTSVADSLTNAWLTLCDLRAGLKATNIAIPSGCNLITIDFSVLISGSGPTLSAKIVFLGHAVIPDNFSDCLSGSQIVFKDATGNTFTSNINIAALKNSEVGTTILLGNTILNTASDFDITLNSCLTDGRNSCSRITEKKTLNPSICPNLTAIPDTNSINFSFNNTGTGATPYTVALMNANGTVIIDTKTFASANPTLSDTFIGLTPLTVYNIRITVNVGDIPHICSLNPVTTTSPVCYPPTGVTAVLS